MTDSAQITALARSAGLAGTAWMTWTAEDVVQDYVMEHGADADVWQAAYEAGVLERRCTVEGWTEHWTTAPAAYDTFGTTTIANEGEWRGHQLRRVLVHPHHVSYQLDRYGSGLHGSWDEDPRETDRKIAAQIERDRNLAAQRAADRVAGQAWLAKASEADLEAALDADEEPRGVTRADVRGEQRRRDEAQATATREAEYVRCRALIEQYEVLVDDGAPSRRSRWGTVPARPSRVYYGVSVDEYPRDPERALVRGVGSLEFVAKQLAEGTLRGARTVDVPPEPVLRRIGHEHLAEIRRMEVAGRVVWIGRPMFAREMLILDDRGHIVRARAIVSAVIAPSG